MTRSATLLFLLAACGGGSPPPAAAPASTGGAPSTTEPTTIEEAQAQFEQAKAMLGDHDAAKTTTDSDCSTVCRAVASMRRSVGALCRLAGNEDARCTSAQKTLGEAETRAAACKCSG
jgi:hypothetical protein